MLGLLALMHGVNAGTALASMRDVVVTSHARSTRGTLRLVVVYAVACLVCIADALRARSDRDQADIEGEDTSRAGLGTGYLGAGVRRIALAMGYRAEALVVSERLAAGIDPFVALAVGMADWPIGGRLGVPSLAHVTGRVVVGMLRMGLGAMQAEELERQSRRQACMVLGKF